MSTTGEAGPESASGQPVGTVHVAVSGPSGTTTRELDPLPGAREDIQSAAVEGALRLLVGVLSHEKAGRQLGPMLRLGTSRTDRAFR